MEIFVKIARKNEKGSNVALQAVAMITDMDREKLHHPELRPRIEGELKDLHLQLEEGRHVHFSRMMDLDVTFDELADFKNDCMQMLNFINDLEIPTEEEAEQSQQSPTSEEMELIKTLLKDFEESKVYGVEFVVLRQDDFGKGGITPKLWKELLTSFMKTHGQQD